MTLQTIDPAAAKRLIDQGAILVDIREPDEHARERVPGARNTPLSRLGTLPATAKAIVFHCRSGARTSANASRLAAAAGCHTVTALVPDEAGGPGSGAARNLRRAGFREAYRSVVWRTPARVAVW